MTTHKVVPISTAPAKPATSRIGSEVTARLLDGHTEAFFLNDQSTPEKKQSTLSARRSRSADPAGMGSCIEALISPERKYWMKAHAVGVLAGAAKPPHDAVLFSTVEELMARTADWPPQRFVDTWNTLSGHRKVKRFENRSIAVQRLWRAIECVQPEEVNSTESNSECTKVQRASKTDLVVDLLKAPGGASLATLMEATGWQAHSVRGFLSRTRHSGFRLCSVRRDGERIYALEPAPEPDDICTEPPDARD